MYGASTHKFMYGNRPQAKGRCELDGTGNIMESISLIEDGEQPGRSTLSYLPTAAQIGSVDHICKVDKTTARTFGSGCLHSD